jgi:hypothetical protein
LAITGWLTLGSVSPALTLWFLRFAHRARNDECHHQTGAGRPSHGAGAILFKKACLSLRTIAGGNYNPSGKRLNVMTVIAWRWAPVALTSIGAALAPWRCSSCIRAPPTRRLVGTEIAHAVPLTLVAGLGHASMGNMDWHVLGYLLVGSLPGIYLGSHLTGRISDEVLRPCLATMLLLIGYKLAF